MSRANTNSNGDNGEKTEIWSDQRMNQALAELNADHKRLIGNEILRDDEISIDIAEDGGFTLGRYIPNPGTIPEDHVFRGLERLKKEKETHLEDKKPGFLARAFSHVTKKDVLKDIALGAAFTSVARWSVIGFGTAVGLSGIPVVLGGAAAAAVARTAYTIQKERKAFNAQNDADMSFWDFAAHDKKKYLKSLGTSTAFATLGSTFAMYALPHAEQWARPVVDVTKEYTGAAFATISGGISSALSTGKNFMAPKLDAADKYLSAQSEKASNFISSAAVSAFESSKKIGSAFSRWVGNLFQDSKPVPVAAAPATPAAPPMTRQELNDLLRAQAERAAAPLNEWLTGKPPVAAPLEPSKPPMTNEEFKDLFAPRDKTRLGAMIDKWLAAPVAPPAPETATPSAAQATVKTPAPVAPVLPEITVRDKIAALTEDRKLNKLWTAIAERAMAGDPLATKDVAKAVLNGTNGFERNPAAAVELYQASGTSQAKVDLAYMKFHGLGGLDADKKGALSELRALGRNGYAKSMIENLTGAGAAKKTAAAAMQRAAESPALSSQPVAGVTASAVSTAMPDNATLNVAWSQNAEGKIQGYISKEDAPAWLKDGDLVHVPTARIRPSMP